MTNPPIHICIVAHNAYGSISGAEGHIGGVELQAGLLARYLVEQGCTTSVITWAPDKRRRGRSERSAGIEIQYLCTRDDGVSGLKFLHPRWTSLNAALRAMNADVYFHSGAEYVTGQVALFCKRYARRFIFCAASDTDCDSNLPELRSLRERVLYRYGLRNAENIIVQTHTQSEKLATGFGLSSIVLPMPCAFTANGLAATSEPPTLIWIGRLVRSKRVEWFLRLANEFPYAKFKVVGGADGDEEYAAGVAVSCEALKNVEYLGAVPHERVREELRNAHMLVCTSELEGFPNTFLEAWSFGLPIVSTFDPDSLIESERLGVAATNFEQVVAGVAGLLSNHEAYKEKSKNCRQFFATRHTRDVALARFLSVLAPDASQRCLCPETNVANAGSRKGLDAS